MNDVIHGEMGDHNRTTAIGKGIRQDAHEQTVTVNVPEGDKMDMRDAYWALDGRLRSIETSLKFIIAVIIVVVLIDLSTWVLNRIEIERLRTEQQRIELMDQQRDRSQ